MSSKSFYAPSSASAARLLAVQAAPFGSAPAFLAGLAPVDAGFFLFTAMASALQRRGTAITWANAGWGFLCFGGHGSGVVHVDCVALLRGYLAAVGGGAAALLPAVGAFYAAQRAHGLPGFSGGYLDAGQRACRAALAPVTVSLRAGLPAALVSVEAWAAGGGALAA